MSKPAEHMPIIPSADHPRGYAEAMAARPAGGTVRAAQHHAQHHAVDAGTDLASGARDLAAAAVAAGLSRPERTSRARRAADAVADAGALLPVLDVYGDGRHSRIADVVAMSSAPFTNAGLNSGLDGAAAAERIALDATHRDLALLSRDFTDTTNGVMLPAALGDLAGRACVLLNGPLALPALPGAQYAKTVRAPMWTTIPAASLDPVPGAPVNEVEGLLDGVPLDWHSSSAVIPASLQFVDWAAVGPELDRMLGLVVDLTLEKAVIADLTTAAVAAANFSAAEVAVGGSGLAADTIVCSPADKPKIVRAYATEGVDPADRPAIIATAGATTGTALVLAAAGVRLQVTDGTQISAMEPHTMGIDIAVGRWAQVSVRLAGAVQSVTVA